MQVSVTCLETFTTLSKINCNLRKKNKIFSSAKRFRLSLSCNFQDREITLLTAVITPLWEPYSVRALTTFFLHCLGNTQDWATGLFGWLFLTCSPITTYLEKTKKKKSYFCPFLTHLVRQQKPLTWCSDERTTQSNRNEPLWRAGWFLHRGSSERHDGTGGRADSALPAPICGAVCGTNSRSPAGAPAASAALRTWRRAVPAALRGRCPIAAAAVTGRGRSGAERSRARPRWAPGGREERTGPGERGAAWGAAGPGGAWRWRCCRCCRCCCRAAWASRRRGRSGRGPALRSTRTARASSTTTRLFWARRRRGASTSSARRRAGSGWGKGRGRGPVATTRQPGETWQGEGAAGAARPRGGRRCGTAVSGLRGGSSRDLAEARAERLEGSGRCLPGSSTSTSTAGPGEPAPCRLEGLAQCCPVPCTAGRTASVRTPPSLQRASSSSSLLLFSLLPFLVPQQMPHGGSCCMCCCARCWIDLTHCWRALLPQLLASGSLARTVLVWIKFKPTPPLQLHFQVLLKASPHCFSTFPHLCQASYSLVLASLLLFMPSSESMQQVPYLTASLSLTHTGSQIAEFNSSSRASLLCSY